MYHFIGIKGSGMSALAIILKARGYKVQGSDYPNHFFTEDNLIKNKIKILPFKKENIKKRMIIVKGNMFNEENIEVREAINKKLKIYSYQEMISKIIKDYNTIAITGCHGKTTTSKLLAHVINPNYIIGDGSGGASANNYFVLEACEYKRHFLNYNPNYTIITNIDLDHVDYYKNMKDVINAYNEFANQSSIVLACGDDNNVKKIKHKNIFYYGINKKNYFNAKNIIYNNNGISFDFYIKNKYKSHFDLPFYGKHMLLNTLAVISFCYLEKINIKDLNKKLQTFKGAKRRFNEIRIEDNIVIDDYAHHPNEIESVINAVKQKYPKKQIIGILEPHTYSRTIKFAKQIAKQLNKCTYAYVLDIYKSREKQQDYQNVDSNIIIKHLRHGKKYTEDTINELTKYKNAVLLFMSPNDMKDLENKYIKNYKILFDKQT